MMPKVAAKLRQRTEKINSEQKKIVLQFIACTPEIINTTVTPEFSLLHHQQFWQNLSTILNLFGPPRKPADSWKKTWKDYRCRFRKNNVDLVEALNYLKNENPVDTEVLLERAEKMKTNEEKLSLRRSVWNLVVECLPEIVITNFQIHEQTFAVSNDADFDNECSMSNDGDSPENMEMKAEAVDDSTETLVAVLEDSETENNTSTNQTENGDASAEKDLENITEIFEQNLVEESTNWPARKRPKLSDPLANSDEPVTTESSRPDETRPNETRPKEFQKNGMKKNTLEDLLIELRKFNKIQADKLALKKSYVDYKKMMLRNTYNVQKEMAKSQSQLATSVKTFIENISFNT